MNFNNLDNFRYSITGLANGNYPAFPLADVASPKPTMATTYDNLINYHLNRLREESTSSNPEQILRNSQTALRSFLSCVGKTNASPIGQEMSSDFDGIVSNHLRTLSLSARSISDRKSLLNSWRASFQAMGAAPNVEVRGRERRSAKVPAINPTPFETGLRAALRDAGLTPKTAAKLAGVSPGALGRWARGALPNCRSDATLQRLEVTLALAPGHLNSLYEASISRFTAKHPNEYRIRLKGRTKDTFFLKAADLGPGFLAQWDGLVKYKLEVFPRKGRRHTGGKWTVSGEAENCVNPIPGITTFNGLYIASAEIGWTHTRALLGFLSLPLTHGGFGLTGQENQSLAWLTIPEAIDAFMAFQKERSGGICHQGHGVFAGFIASLTHPNHGYLTRHPELMQGIPDSFQLNRSWDDLCKETRELALNWKAEAVGISRDPYLSIQFLLDQPEPLLPIFEAMRQLHARGDSASAGSVEEAICRRNELLIGLLVSNPLRRKNIIELTYRPNNTGTLYQSATGEWRIRIANSSFKNGRGKTRSQRYDVAVAPWLHGLVAEYVRTFRPVFAGNQKNDHVFLSSRNGGPLRDLTHVVLGITRKFIPGSGGFGPHGFRHLVATDWLRRNPNDFLTVAELLNDTLEVVMTTYAHLKKDDALSRHSSQLDELLPAHLQKR